MYRLDEWRSLTEAIRKVAGKGLAVMSEPADTFTRECPIILQDDATDAAQRGRIILSFNAHPISQENGSYQALAIKWKLGDGTTETMLIGRYAALVFRMMLSQLEDNQWTELATLLPDATRQ